MKQEERGTQVVAYLEMLTPNYDTYQLVAAIYVHPLVEEVQDSGDLG